MTDECKDAQIRGDGVVIGSPGIYHYAAPHDYTPSRQWGFGVGVDALCGRASGLVYDNSVLGLWPNDRLCKWCKKAAHA